MQDQCALLEDNSPRSSCLCRKRPILSKLILVKTRATAIDFVEMLKVKTGLLIDAGL